MIGDEVEGSYNRIMLSSVLAQETAIDNIIQKNQRWYKNEGIRFLAGHRATVINKSSKLVTTHKGAQIFYDHLVIATGSRAANIPAKNCHLENIFSFRSIKDTQKILNLSKDKSNALVIGGGLLGLEAAYGLAKLGLKVKLLHRSNWLLNRQLDRTPGKMLQKIMEPLGIEFILGDEVDHFLAEVERPATVSGATLKSGKTLSFEMAVIATGITPNAELGDAIGLKGERAIIVDDYMQTNDANISAIGECIEHKGQTFGLVDPLWRHASTLACRLIENKLEPFENSAIATKLKVSGVQLFSAGSTTANKEQRELVISDPSNNVYRKLILEKGKIEGIVLFGDVRSGAYYFELMQKKLTVDSLLPELLIAQEFTETNIQQHNSTSAL